MDFEKPFLNFKFVFDLNQLFAHLLYKYKSTLKVFDHITV